jgi:hypothetical protein
MAPLTAVLDFPKKLQDATGVFCFCRRGRLPDHSTLSRVSRLYRPSAHIPPQCEVQTLLRARLRSCLQLSGAFHRRDCAIDQTLS